MSWLARSLATSLNLPDDSGADDDPDADAAASSTPSPSARIPPPPPLPPPPPHSAAAEGVKEDLTELSKTLTRQFWGVANFLAPPPGEASPSPSPSPQSVGGQSGDAGTPPEIAGIRNDFAEIGGRFKSGISRISSHKAVTGFSKMASNFFAPEDDEESEWEDERRRHARYEMGQEAARHGAPEADEEWHQWEERVRLGVEDDRVGHELVDGHEMEIEKHEEDGELEVQRVRHGDGGEFGLRHEEDVELEEQRVRQEEEEEEDWDVIGITEEVLAFATNIARHPETWLDFPLLPDDDESDGPFSCNFSTSVQVITSG
ncbi:hypothetical protein HU200_048139 [Digitaria exilis]|uniref:BSD domain-containing protein n=1 Tax=Digitaria exilis TaxID=1010633 RepID=A0A835E9I6_9POAL|nr:hypothetical protein HU200_048139 [Digitaria exilis]